MDAMKVQFPGYNRDRERRSAGELGDSADGREVLANSATASARF
jgi:hypothetical protein